MAGIMFLQFYRLREQPFGANPDPEYLYLSGTHRRALDSLIYGVESGIGFSALIAPPGMGKTTLLVTLLHHFEDSARTAFLFETQGSSQELLQALIEDFEIDKKNEPGGEHELPLARIHRFLLENAQAGQRVLLVVDEAQNLQIPVFETLRLLSNYETPKAKLLQIVLAGQPQLTRKLARPELEQLRQRVAVSCKLDAFTSAETVGYVAHRLRCADYRGGPLFTPEALAMLATSGRGIPREINRLCFNALSVGFTMRKRVIDAGVMGQAVSQLEGLLGEVEGVPENSGSLPPGLTPQDLGLLFARAMAAPAEAMLQGPSEVAGNEAGPQPLAAAPTTSTGWMEELNLLAQADYQPSPERRGAVALIRRYGLIAVAAAVVCAGLVWSGGISSSVSAMRERAIKKAEDDRALAVRNAQLRLNSSSAPSSSTDQRKAIDGTGSPADQLDAPAAEPLLPPQETDGEAETPVKALDENNARSNRARTLSGSERSRQTQASILRRNEPPARSTLTAGRREAAAPSPAPSNSQLVPAGQSGLATAPSTPAMTPLAAAPAAPPLAAVNGVPGASNQLASAQPDTHGSTNHAESARGPSEQSAPTIVPSKLLRRVNPVYPEVARKQGISGGVVLSAHINVRGTVEEVHAISGDPVLAQAAIDAVRQWVFSPSLRNGEPQPSDETIVVGFSLR